MDGGSSQGARKLAVKVHFVIAKGIAELNVTLHVTHSVDQTSD